MINCLPILQTGFLVSQAQPTKTEHYDLLIIGAGGAGLSMALHCANFARVCVLSKGSISQGATQWAQGGIAAVFDASDSFDAHMHDTLETGAGLCDDAVVRMVVENAPNAIHWLDKLGVGFTRTAAPPHPFHLTREGGHTHRRVVHTQDATGRAVHHGLLATAQKHPNIHLRPNTMAVDLIIDPNTHACTGAYVLNTKTQYVHTISARAVVLATGGASRAYLYSTNPDVASGDGIALAWRAGCRIVNLEFNQFHPTCLYHPTSQAFLLTEALRGEGAYLRNLHGTRFMHAHDARGELAPRDIVARAIDHELKRTGDAYVLLDIQHKSKDFIRSHFPNIYQHCLDLGYDMTLQSVPVVPAAHYTCGGIQSDDMGRTDIPNLYAIGETAHTGLHGANRLASNSLLECVVFAERAAKHFEQVWSDIMPPNAPAIWDDTKVVSQSEAVLIAHNWDELRRTLWDYVGIVRSLDRLEQAKKRCALILDEVQQHYARYRVTPDLLELRNLATVAHLIVASSQMRRESRGLHYLIDHPEAKPGPAQHTILKRDVKIKLFSRILSNGTRNHLIAFRGLPMSHQPSKQFGIVCGQ